MAPLQLGREARAIDRAFSRLPLVERPVVRSEYSTRIADLSRALVEFEPTVLHFCGHATEDGALIFETEEGMAERLDGLRLRQLIGQNAVRSTLRLVVLNACSSDSLAPAIEDAVPCVVGMNRKMNDTVSPIFAEKLYEAIASRLSIKDAVLAACKHLDAEGFPESRAPVVRGKFDSADVFVPLPAPEDKQQPLWYRGYFPIPADKKLFVGRDDVIEDLDAAWASPVQVFQIVADGGVGKSTIAWNWINRFEQQERDRPAQVFLWSFYSQGVHYYSKDSNKFVRAAEEHFKLQPQSDDADRGRAIAQAFKRTGGIMILDGVEPLQYPPNEYDGRVKDIALATFLREMGCGFQSATAKQRLLVVTSRWLVPDCHGKGGESCSLGNFDAESGSKLLQGFRLGDDERAIFVPGTTEEQAKRVFEAAVMENGGHALALTLLASYVLERFEGDLTERPTEGVDPKRVFDDNPYRHARRMMTLYEKMFSENATHLSQACHQILCIVSLFTRPVSRDLVVQLLKPPIDKLSTALDDDSFHSARRRLVRLRILSEAALGKDLDEWILDTHPLVRTHYQGVLDREAERRAHERLFQFLSEQAEGDTTSFSAMEMLIDAITHGCQAGLVDEAFDLYSNRIKQGASLDSLYGRGAIAPLKSMLSHFFEPNDWSAPRIDDNAKKRTLLMDATNYMVLTEGYTLGKAAKVIAETTRLTAALGDTAPPHEQLRAHYHTWNVDLAACKFENAEAKAKQMMEIAGGDREMQVAAYSSLGIPQMYRGNFEQASELLGKGSAIYNELSPQWTRFVYATDPGIANGCYLALCKAICGHIDEALMLIKDAVVKTSQIKNRFNHCFALHIASTVFRCARLPQQSLEYANALEEAANVQHFPLWIAAAEANKGWCQIAQGQVKAGLTSLESGVKVWHTMVSNLVHTHWCALRAEGHLAMARFNHEHREIGLRVIEKGLDAVAATGECYFEAELYRLRGRIFAMDEQTAKQAVESFVTALLLSERQGAGLFSYRSARDLRLLAEKPCDDAVAAMMEVSGHLEKASKALRGPANSQDLGEMAWWKEVLHKVN